MSKTITHCFYFLLLFVLPVNVLIGFVSPMMPSTLGESFLEEEFFFRSASCLEADSLELVNFYNATGGDNWTNNSGWLVAPVSEWFGVTLSADGCSVISISLASNNLIGDVADLDLNFLSLQTLFLRGNQLSGSIPDFCCMPNLTNLNLRLNLTITGSIPDFSNLPNLETFYAAGNALTGSIPDFSNLPNLKLLLLKNNQLTGTIPNFSNLPNLQDFQISGNGNQISGKLPKFSNCPNIQRIWIGNNNLSGKMPNYSHLTNLNSFHLDNNNFIFSDFYDSWISVSSISDLTNATQSPIPIYQSGDYLYVNAGGNISDNHYTWYKDGVEVASIDGSNLFQITEAGTYHAEITNDIVTTLTLVSEELNTSPSPTNYDDCSAAISLNPIAAQEYGTFSNIDATTIAGDTLPNCFDDHQLDNTVWFSFIGDGKTYTISTTDCNTNPDAMTNTQMTVFEGTDCSSLTELSCNDDIGESLHASLKLTTSNNTHYYLMVDGNEGNTGNFCLDFSNSCLYKDSLELVGFYHLMGGENWTNNSGWLVAPLSEWHGVTLTNDGCSVSTIVLTNNNLSGNLQDLESLSLPNLTGLILNKNHLTGFIPDFTSIPNLYGLHVSDNELTGEIPDFSHFTNLANIFAQRNNLTGVIPDFSNLPTLRNLYIGANQLTGNIPDFSNTPDLNKIHSTNNQLNGQIPDFSNTPYLIDLWVGGNELSGEIPNFTNTPNLTSMRLFGNNLEGDIPNFSNLSNLEELLIDSNQFIFSNILNAWGFTSNLTTYRYAPQAMVPIHIEVGQLSVEVGGNLADNQYTWYKDGEILPNMPIIGDSTLTVTEPGSYCVAVTNDIVTQPNVEEHNLVLNSECTATITVSIDAIRGKSLTLQAIPNPSHTFVEVQLPTSLTSSIISYQILGLDGRIWEKQDFPSNASFDHRLRIDWNESIPNGTYFLYLQLEDGSFLRSEQLVKF